MAINFPTSPSTNDTFTAGSITYKWDGAKWIGLGVTPTDRLLEGSNSLEITAGNELIWTGGKVGVNQVTPIAIFHAKSGANDGSLISTFEGATNNKLNIRFDTFGPVLDVTAGDPLVFEIGGSEALRINSSRQLVTKGRIFINNTNGGFDYNTTADTLEVLTTNGGTHSEFNSGAFVPSGSKNLGATSKRWDTIYGNTINLATGIDFSANANAAGMTSELLDDYEEGTWSPEIKGWNGSYSVSEAGYIKIGRQVFISGEVKTDATTGTGTNSWPGLSNLPFVNTTSFHPVGGSQRYMGNGTLLGDISPSGSGMAFVTFDRFDGTSFFPNHITPTGANNFQNTMINNITTVNFGMRFNCTYFTD